VSNDLSLAQQSQGRLSTIDNTPSTVADAINSAMTTATQGADGSVSTSQMATLATQAQSILTQVIGSANMQHEGAYVFGGDQVLSAPYSASGTYSGDNSINSVTFSDRTTAQMTFVGQSIFGQYYRFDFGVEFARHRPQQRQPCECHRRSASAPDGSSGPFNGAQHGRLECRLLE
jgi:flagellin-like hook-associated protein FlgL